MKTIRIQLDCNGDCGCHQTSEFDYKINERSLKLLLEKDPHLEMSTFFGVTCPKCGNSYAFKPSKLRSMLCTSSKEDKQNTTANVNTVDVSLYMRNSISCGLNEPDYYVLCPECGKIHWLDKTPELDQWWKEKIKILLHERN